MYKYHVISYYPKELSSYHPNHHHQEEASFEIEDKVFTKTVLATKVLKVGKVVFTIIMVLVVLVLAGLGKAGVALSPVVLPIVLLPIGFLALLLFIPLFFVYVPLAATGLVGEKKKRSIVKQEDISLTEDFLARFEVREISLLPLQKSFIYMVITMKMNLFISRIIYHNFWRNLTDLDDQNYRMTQRL